ncbi:MAG: DUF3450 family protein [Chitinivibrionales bacterium]|nr:DUF3450 family protein [Chitinivibrionales bacterium]MBD3394932.1 DUF3450 family protein [Chitinivibrionales bacterium]
MAFRLCCALSATAVLLVAPGLHAQDADLDAEIKRVRRELMQVQEERERTVQEQEKDAKDFEEYRKRTVKRMREIRHETDSIKQDIRVYKAQNDSLAALVDAERSRQKQYGLLQEDFRKALIDASDRIAEFAARFPPSASKKPLSALHLLKNDLNTKSIDNVEGINRLFQISRDMHEATASVQIVQGSSPIPDLRGTTYSLRIGTLFEAIVNATGTRAAVLTGRDDNGNPQWRVISDAAVAGQILKAVNVREGKALPELVELPLQEVAVVKEDAKQKQDEAPTAKGDE